MAPLIGRFYNDRANGRASLACKDLLLLANGRAQAKRKCPVVQTLVNRSYGFSFLFPTFSFSVNVTSIKYQVLGTDSAKFAYFLISLDIPEMVI